MPAAAPRPPRGDDVPTPNVLSKPVPCICTPVLCWPLLSLVPKRAVDGNGIANYATHCGPIHQLGFDLPFGSTGAPAAVAVATCHLPLICTSVGAGNGYIRMGNRLPSALASPRPAPLCLAIVLASALMASAPLSVAAAAATADPRCCTVGSYSSSARNRYSGDEGGHHHRDSWGSFASEAAFEMRGWGTGGSASLCLTTKIYDDVGSTCS